ncbi:hypothetical protein BKN51_18030 [Amycolatopsis sp. BJA-103]|nr:hypothetical protein BKN51_18030 [Amycolatopsis sp. BJA-103]
MADSAARKATPSAPSRSSTRFVASKRLQARPAMVADFRADRDGFLDAQLIRVDDETWLDVVWWRSSEDFAASREKGANLPGIKAFFAPIAELVSAEEGTTEDYRA